MNNPLSTGTMTRFNYWLSREFNGMTANDIEDKLQSRNIPWEIAHNFIYTIIYAVYVGIATIEEYQRYEAVRQYFA